MNKYEVLQIVAHLLHGKEPVIPNYPVCVECKRREPSAATTRASLHGAGRPRRLHGSLPGRWHPLRGLPRLRRTAQPAALEKVLIERAGFPESGPPRRRGCSLPIHWRPRDEHDRPHRRRPSDPRRGSRQHRRQLTDGKVEKCEWQVPEAPRFFESMVRGRHYTEVARITSRICGICSIGHTLASLKATENALGIEVTSRAGSSAS